MVQVSAGWMGKEACDVLTPEVSDDVRKSKPELNIPTRWVRTNKAENPASDPFKAKSRLAAQDV